MRSKTRNRLRVLRAEVRITQLVLAKRARLNATRYWQIENEVANPATDDERARIASVLRVSEAEIWPHLAPPEAAAR